MWCGHVYIYAQLYYSWAYILYNAMQRPRAKLMAKVPIGWAEGHQPSVPNNSKRFGRNIEECQKPPATRQANGAQGAMGLWLLSSFWGNVVFDGVFLNWSIAPATENWCPARTYIRGSQLIQWHCHALLWNLQIFSANYYLAGCEQQVWIQHVSTSWLALTPWPGIFGQPSSWSMYLLVWRAPISSRLSCRENSKITHTFAHGIWCQLGSSPIMCD